MDILKEKHATIGSNQSLRNKINLIRSEGIEALDRMSADVELIILLRWVPCLLKIKSVRP